MDFDFFTMQMKKTATIFNFEMSPELVSEFWEQFQGWSDDEFGNAMFSIRKNDKFFPKPVDVREWYRPKKKPEPVVTDVPRIVSHEYTRRHEVLPYAIAMTDEELLTLFNDEPVIADHDAADKILEMFRKNRFGIMHEYVVDLLMERPLHEVHEKIKPERITDAENNAGRNRIENEIGFDNDDTPF